MLTSLGLGTAPGSFAEVLRLGLALRIAPTWRRLSLPMDLAIDTPGTFEDTARRATAHALPAHLSAALCHRFGERIAPFACGVVGVSVVFAWGDGYSPNASDAAIAVSVGARAGVVVPLSQRWSFLAELDLRALPLRPALAIDAPVATLLWTAPPVAATLLVGVAWTNR